MNDIDTDTRAEAEQPASGESSKSGFVNIFLQEFRRLKRIVAGMGLNASDADDVLQDVSIQALQQAGEYRNADEAMRWLIKVTVNQCLMEHRRRRCFSRTAWEILKRRPETKAYSTRPDQKAIDAEELEIVRETLRELDESLLVPFMLRYFCELNSKMISEILNLNPSTVRSRLREGRLILAKRLLERGIEQ